VGTSREPQYLIDTSVIIAMEQGRPLGEIPTDGAWFISAITVGELKHGALTGGDPASRAQRLDTWIEARELFEVIDVDDPVGNTWGEYRAIATGERRTIRTEDALIAATAATCGMTLVTQDRGFEWYPDLDVLVV
jgi:predicted nucleic acid-binding protein